MRVSRAGGPWLGVMVLTAVVLAIFETILPAVLGRAVDALVTGEESTTWLVACSALVAVLVVCDAADDVAVGHATARSTAWLRHSLLGHLLALPPRTSARFDGGDLTSRLVADASVTGRVGPQLVRIATNLVPGLGSIVALAWIDPWLALTFVVGLPALLFVMATLTRDATEASEKYMQSQGAIAARLVDALAGSRTIAAAATVDLEIERVLAPAAELQRQGLRMWRVFTRSAVQQALTLPLLELAVLATAGALLVRGRITVGEFVAAGQYAALGARIGALESLVQVARSRAGATRATEVLAEPPLRHGDRVLPPGGGQVQLRGVTVRRGATVALEAVDLLVPAGALVGVAGGSGSGKSLLAGLVSRVVDPDAGEVLLDGVPIHELERAELRRAVGHGFASPVLIGETISDAIAFGADTPSEDEIAAAARSAQADGFISRMPRGYGTALAEAPMSGGELQRVGLARTFAHTGRVLVLDDIAASLDTVTEQLIRQVLTGPLAGRTRIVIVRRATTAAAVDTVVWLDHGRVRAVAPHETLWADPDYRSLFTSDLPSPVPVGAEGGSR